MLRVISIFRLRLFQAVLGWHWECSCGKPKIEMEISKWQYTQSTAIQKECVTMNFLNNIKWKKVISSRTKESLVMHITCLGGVDNPKCIRTFYFLFLFSFVSNKSIKRVPMKKERNYFEQFESNVLEPFSLCMWWNRTTNDKKSKWIGKSSNEIRFKCEKQSLLKPSSMNECQYGRRFKSN